MALDFSSFEAALPLAERLASLVGIFKINIHLFTAEGPAAVNRLAQLGPCVFLDLKYHDIPNTVRGAVSAAAGLTGVTLLDVHALGGLEMMRAAKEGLDGFGAPKQERPRLLAVTILTSMDASALRKVGVSGTPSKRVVQLARLAKQAGLDGVVASPQEIRTIRRACGKDFLIVVPGIRLGGGTPGTRGGKGRKDDQARVATPAEAIRAGADFLVVGRPITAAPDPEAAAQAILEEMAGALR